jgi:hypothetical protein
MKVVVITFQTGTESSLYSREVNLPWPLLLDEKKEVYSAYGMLKADFLDIWGPRSWWSYLKEMARGNLPKKSDGDIYQRGGDVLIDPTGMVRLHHVGKGPADRPSVESIIAFIT